MKRHDKGAALAPCRWIRACMSTWSSDALQGRPAVCHVFRNWARPRRWKLCELAPRKLHECPWHSEVHGAGRIYAVD